MDTYSVNFICYCLIIISSFNMPSQMKKNSKHTITKLFKLINKLIKIKVVRVLLWFTFGVLLGIGLYEIVLSDLEFSDSLSTWIGLTLCLTLGIGNALSTQIRCISLLTLPSICGRAGRSALKALVFTFLLAGPIKNLTLNAREVVRVFSCTTELTYNLTKTKFDLMYKPFQEALLNMKADVTEVKGTMKSINGVVRPISSEIENEQELEKEMEDNDYIDEMQGDTKRSVEIKEKYKMEKSDSEGQKYEKEYSKKLETRCEEVLTRGTERCHKMFREAYNRCYDKVSVIAAWLLCWPMKLTFVCNIMEAMGGGSGTCDANKEVEPGFGESFAAIKESGSSLEGKRGQMNDVKIKYEPIEFNPPLNVADAKEAAESLEQEFKSKKSIFDVVSVIIRRLLLIIFLKVLLNAQEYHDKYLEDIFHDNNWMTAYFRHIDARRHAVEKMTLLPLKKSEKANLCSPTAVLPSSSEGKAFVLQFAKIILETITATVFVLLDKLLYEILMIVRKHSKIDYSQAGTHDLIITVKGSGMMARLVRSILDGFNIKQEVNNERSNFECLPNPKKMSPKYLGKIYGIYFTILILIFTEAYTQRLRRVICSIFYRKREKQRILFLYNQNLKKRANHIKRTAAAVKHKSKVDNLSKKINILLYLRFRYPKYFGWLYKVTALAQRKCLICGQREGRKGIQNQEEMMEDRKDKVPLLKTKKWHICDTPECHALYCLDCWMDIENVCYACSSKSDAFIPEDESENEESKE